METRRRWFERPPTHASGAPAGSRAALGLIPALLLVTPVVVFLRANHYALARPEALLLLACFCLPGLACALVFRRRRLAALLVMITTLFFAEMHFSSLGVVGAWALVSVSYLCVYNGSLQRIALAMLTTLLLSSLVLAAVEDARSHEFVDGAPSSAEPFVLEIILDGHIGLEGLRAAGPEADALAGEIERFFAKRGFTVFQRAYSEYSETRASLSQAFNLSQGAFDEAHFSRGPAPFEWRLTRNRVFESLQASGHAVRVFQSDHIDLCAPTPQPAITCVTHPVKEVGVLQDSSLSTVDRVRIIAAAYLERSHFYRLARLAYQEARPRLDALGVHVSRWTWDYPGVSSVGTMRVTRSIEDELRRAGPGRAVVVHLLLPHEPFVFDAQCRQNPVAAWENSADLDQPRRQNTADDRQRRYAAYVAQARCLYAIVGPLLDAIPEPVRATSTIVVHGDHGSRIATNDPEARGQRVTRGDLLDDYSTLFAIRSPRAGTGGNDDLVPLSCLLRASLIDHGPFLDAVASCKGAPQVYLAGTGRFVPYPD